MTLSIKRRPRILGEAAWVVFGQGASALAALVGMRLITESVPPAVYGTVVLALGLVALAHGLAAGPLMQAVLRFYPATSQGGCEAELRHAALLALRKPILVTLAVLMMLGAAWASLQPQHAWLVASMPALFVLEVVRTVEITFLNAARRQRAMALLVAVDAWLRPLFAVALVWIFGPNSAAVIAGYMVGCALALIICRLPARASSSMRETTVAVAADVSQQLWAYALPLAALPLIGWVSGQADRYLLGSIAGAAAAGTFAALYGLASKPFLMYATTVELALRQQYYERVTVDDAAGERKALMIWLAVIVAGSLALCALFMLLHVQIAALVLAADYRAHSGLMGFIAMGHLLLCASQVLQRVCYAHHDTRGVLWIEGAGAALSVLVTAPLVWLHGIEGAAWAVPVYFGVQLVLAAGRSRFASHFRPRAVTKPLT